VAISASDYRDLLTRAAARHLTLHIAPDQGEALGELRRRHIVEQDVVAGQGADVGDTTAHLARPDHAYGSDLRHQSPRGPQAGRPYVICSIERHTPYTNASPAGNDLLRCSELGINP
jgi:hypothetical protein